MVKRVWPVKDAGMDMYSQGFKRKRRMNDDEKWLFHYRLTDKESKRLYFRQLAEYNRNKDFFSNEGFNFAIAKQLLPIAMLTVWDLFHLFFYAKRVPNGGTYLEIGSATGGSLVCAFLGSQVSGNIVHFVAVENFRYGADIKKEGKVEAQFLRNTRCIPNFELLKCSSDVARHCLNDESVDLLFIDGDHSYSQVKKDLLNHGPKLKKNGVLLGHDYTTSYVPGVKKAADELLGKKLVVLKNSSIFGVRKKEE